MSACDFALVFVTARSGVGSAMTRVAPKIATGGQLWFAWPKKASGMATDMNENDVRRIGLEAGLVDVKVCAVSDVWSGLKFVRRVEDRKAK